MTLPPDSSSAASPAADLAGQPPVFAYEAQTDTGQRMTGTLEAGDAAEATGRLRAMRLRVMELSPLTRRPVSRPLRAEDFLAFNQQLAQLAAAGMPIEQGLKLIAADIHRRRLSRTIQQLAAELERGTPIDQAFDRFRGSFPPLYGKLVAAGVRSGNLPAILLNLSRHLDLLQRLRATLWRTVAYPLLVLIVLGLLVSFIGIVILPQFASLYAGFHIRLPLITEALLVAGRAAPAVLIAILALLILGPIVWRVLRRLGYSTRAIERLGLPMPLIGRVLRLNLVARWCDATRIAVAAGLDLPSAIDLAADATASPGLRADGQELIAALSGGRPLISVDTRLLPATVPAAIQFASAYHDLPATLNSLSEMYQRQAELRMNVIPGVLTPLLLLLIAAIVVFVVLGLFAPFIMLIHGLSGS